MKIFKKAKDGGKESTVTGYWLIEIKSLFSIVLLKFENGSRDVYHSHAFDSLNWILSGCVKEYLIENDWDGESACAGKTNYYKKSLFPVLTKRSTFHKVVSIGTTWVFAIRGPWSKSWKEFDPKTNEIYSLKNGRIKI